MSELLNKVGFILVGVGLIMSGVLSSGYQIRANYSDESLKQKMKRMNWSAALIIIGLVILGFNYFLFKK